MDEPIKLPMQPAYNGCKSWVKLEGDAELRPASMKPVVDDDKFQSEWDQIRDALA
ncbi:DUF1802 family protein [Paenibacillus sp. MCAF20]